MQRNKPTADQRVAPQTPDFGVNESQRRVVQTILTARDTYYGRARTHTARANEIGAVMDEKNRQFEALRQELTALMEDKNAEESKAQDNWADYQANEDALKLMGVQVPAPVDPQPYPPLTSVMDANAHAAQWNGLSDPTPTGRAYQSPEPIGKCTSDGCGEPLWQGATGPVHAYGGKECFPEREDTPKAQIAEPVQ